MIHRHAVVKTPTSSLAFSEGFRPPMSKRPTLFWGRQACDFNPTVRANRSEEPVRVQLPPRAQMLPWISVPKARP